MFKSSFFLAAAFLAITSDQSIPEGTLDQASLVQAACQLEIINGNEPWIDSFSNQRLLEEFQGRYRETRNTPQVGNLTRFLPPQYLDPYYDPLRVELIHTLEKHRDFDPLHRPYFEAFLAELERRERIYQSYRAAWNYKTWNVYACRLELQALKQMIGDENWWQGYLPPRVPLEFIPPLPR